MRALAAIWLGALFSFVGVGAVGCRPYPQRPVVSEVELEPGEKVDVDQILQRLATVETPELFGIFPRVLEYETYEPSVLARDLERIERAYRARGYYEAKVTAARVVRLDEHHVRVEIRVHEGDPVFVAERPDTPGLGSLPLEYSEATNAATRAIVINKGDVFDEARFEGDKAAILRALRSRGFAFAKVEGRATVDIARHEARITYLIEPGSPAKYGTINFVGLREIDEAPVRRALILEPDDDYSSTEIEDAERALIDLGVFSRVEIREDLLKPESGIVPLTVVVEESSLRTIRLGGGVRLDTLRLGFHLRAGWENRNFLGGLRKLSVEARPGVTLFPTSIQNPEAPVRLLPEFRLTSELRQRSFLEGRTTGFIEGQYRFFPVLYPLPENSIPEEESILGYHQITARTGVERSFFLHQLKLRPSYNLQAHYPIYYQEEPDPNYLNRVLVSYPELFSVYEVSEGPVRFILSNELQVAGYIFGGDLSDVRVKPELRTFLRDVFGKRTELALRLGFGFLFPDDYGGFYNTTFDPDDPNSAPQNPPAAARTIRDQQKMLFRAFYSGGPSQNRGYPLRGVGPHGPVGFLLPAPASATNCADAAAKAEPQWEQRCMRSLGGMTLWEFSLEARFPIVGAVGGVVFVDASDVTPYTLTSGTAGTFRFDVPHLSPGVGLRYATPVGPLRLDLAYRVPGFQQIGQRELPNQYGSPSGAADENFLNSYWLPLSLNLAIGEAFE